MILTAVSRVDIANYVGALFTVYIILILLYILLSMVFSLGLRVPYSRWSEAIMNFLRDVSEPYLRLFRRLLPSVGGFDFTPIIALIVLYLAQSIISGVIAG